MFGKPTFGSTPTSSAFGTGSSLFGTPAKPTVGFSNQQTTQNSSLFGQKPLFGSSTPAQQTSLFGSAQPVSSASSSLFGQSKPFFGGTTTQSGFGTSNSLFSASQPVTQSGGLFGGGFGASTTTGTSVKFEPPTATDTMLRNGTNQTINTKHMCITAMKHYEGKSVEELRCDDYIANRKSSQTTGGLTFGQTNQPSTSGLFSTSTASTQSSSLFGQSKSLFGNASSGFGTTATSTPSLFGSQQNTGTSLFGPKKTGLFGTTPTSTTSPFGQTQQTGMGLFGAKPTTGFGTQATSLFGGTSTFGTTASTSSPFSFGATSTASAPFGQSQPATSGFGFGQSATSTGSTGLFGSKPATSGFGSFGAAPATSSAFGTQPNTGGLFGSKPATGGLFGGSTGLFGNTPTTSAPSLFGASGTKPTSFFGSNTGQPAFGAPTASIAVAAPAAPIVLGADVNQTLLQNALIEAQIAASPYGDSPLLKLVPKDTSQKNEIVNPTSVERQMRFLASKKDKGANTTTVNGPSALGSIPAAGLPISLSSLNKSRTSVGDFTYRPVFSPPALKNRVVSPIVNLNSPANRSSLLNGSERDNSVSALLEQNANDLILQNKRLSNVKRLDLAVLHKSMQENRNRTTHQLSSSPPTTHFVNDNLSANSLSQNEGPQQEINSEEVRKGPSLPIQTPIRCDGDVANADKRLSALRKENVASPDTPSIAAERLSGSDKNRHNFTETQGSQKDSTNTGSSSSEIQSSLSSSRVGLHPARIKLQRSDYECEPSLKELAAMAERNGGVCHIEKGFTVRRLAYGSVFWPGPFDLSDVDLDEVVHFRQHEVTVYPNDEKKPPIDEGLNRFAEISLERIWPVVKQTREIITASFKLYFDPLHIERCGFRSKLQRSCVSMGAKFKDYRPETGTWVFTVPHFTKYGLLEDSDDEVPSPEQLKASEIDNRIQSSVQRARPPLGLMNQMDVVDGATKSNTKATSLEKPNQDLYGLSAPLNISELPPPRGLGGDCGDIGSNNFEVPLLNFTQTTIGSYGSGTPADKRKRKKDDGLSKSYFDNTSCLDSVFADSITFEVGENEVDKYKKIELQIVEPVVSLPYIDAKHSVANRFFKNKTSTIDADLYQGRRARIGWATGTKLASSMLPESFSVVIRQLQVTDELLREYLVGLVETSITFSLLCESSSRKNAYDATSFLPSYKTSAETSKMIDAFIDISQKYERLEELKVWKLCKALFTDQSHIGNGLSRSIRQRECVGDWLRDIIAVDLEKESLPISGSSLIFYHLCSGNLEAAVKEAVSSKRFLLAINLATFQHSSRAAYREQVEHWSACGAKDFIDENLLKINLVMAGMSHICVKDREIFVTEGLPWAQAMGLYIWYYCTGETNMSEAVQAFEENVKEERGDSYIFDSVFFLLIKIACNKQCSLEALLEPTAFSLDYLDYHISWHLFCFLEAIGFKNILDTAKYALHIGYAEQLAHFGLTSFAIFVLMHIEHDSSRQNAVSTMADRSAVGDDEAECSRLLELNVPKEIIAHSQYLRAKTRSDFAGMCRCALEAGMYEEAHLLFVEQVGPFAVTNDRLDVLEDFCAKFKDKSSSISNWGPCGQVYVDYYSLHQGIRRIEDDAQVSDLLELAQSLGPRLSYMETKTSLERLSVAVMSRLVYEVRARFEQIRVVNLPISLDKAVDIASSSAHSALQVVGE